MELPASRTALSVALTFAALFVGGAGVGVALADVLAPDSEWAEAVSAFALPLAFILGFQAWLGLALLGMFAHAARRLTGRPATAAPIQPRIPGAIVFVPIASGTGGAAGLIVAWLSSSRSAWLVLPAYWAVGTLYGVLVWRLARAGFLVPPESA
jgi:hypothetical protein